MYEYKIKFTLPVVFLLLFCSITRGQKIDTEWFSETNNNGIIIQNSFPKGGPYLGPTEKNFNYSYLVFFTRIINETETSLALNIKFSNDSIQIPNSPNTFVKLFLPSDRMTLEKRNLFSYGITELESLDKPTNYEKTIKSNEECLFYVVAIFYQTKDEAFNQYRGGNRAELILKGQDLFYTMLPQIDLLYSGNIKKTN